MNARATLTEVIVKPHPAGGWTHARRVAGASCYVYSGNWPTAWAASRALVGVATSTRGLARGAAAASEGVNFGAARASGASPANSGGEHGGRNPATALSSTPLAVAGRADPLFPVISGVHWSRGLALGLRAHWAASQRLRAAVAASTRGLARGGAAAPAADAAEVSFSQP
jgi:hypothetical protein